MYNENIELNNNITTGLLPNARAAIAYLTCANINIKMARAPGDEVDYDRKP